MKTKYEKINHFEPIAMKCNKEQFEEIKPILEEFGLELADCNESKPILVNNLHGYENNIQTLSQHKKNLYDRVYYSKFNKETFLKACGIVEKKVTLKKEPKHKLTSNQIIKAVENPQTLKDLFPKLFEIKLEVGKWYQNFKIGKSLFYIKKLKDGNIYAYGFDYKGNWCDLCDFGKIETYEEKPATPQEVEQALVNEAKKRGFENKRCCIKIDEQQFILEEQIGNYTLLGDILFYQAVPIFYNGTWAEIVETPTDIIKVVEKYGKDKVLTIIEQYKN